MLLWYCVKTVSSFCSVAFNAHRAILDDVYQGFVNDPGGRLNKKDGLTRYGNSHVKDKTS